MNLFNRYHAKRDAPGVGVYEAPPAKGYKRFIFILSTHFTKLITINLLFVLFCIPVLTIPASIAGMTRVLMRLTRDGICDIWEEFWKEFKIDFTKRLLAWLAFTVVPVATAVILAVSGLSGITMGIWIAFGALSFTILCYYFPLITILDVSLSANIKNAFALVIMEWKRSLLMLVGAGGIQVLLFLLFPYSLPILLLVSFSITQLFVCIVVNESIEKLIVK